MPAARRLVLAVTAERLALEDERAAAARYVAMVEREEALAAAVRRLADAHAALSAQRGAMEAAQDDHAREAAQLAAATERMRSERCATASSRCAYLRLPAGGGAPAMLAC